MTAVNNTEVNAFLADNIHNLFPNIANATIQQRVQDNSFHQFLVVELKVITRAIQ
jgi:hypothetical protein